MSTRARLLLALLLPALVTAGRAQSAADSIRLVMPTGAGSIAISTAGGWQPQEFHVYDANTRPAITLGNEAAHLALSYLLFPNTTGVPTSVGCRDAVIPAILESLASSSTVTDKQAAIRTTKDGHLLAIGAYMLVKAGDYPLQQENVFGFYGDAKICAEMHISKVKYVPADKPQLNALLDAFSYDPAYIPTAADYGTMGTILFQAAHEPASAAVYFQRTLDTLPTTPLNGLDPATLRRATTDSLSMAYGLSGDLKRSRAVNEAAIVKDPDYPLYYYNLACADAEEGNAAGARTHLEQAFARRANVLKGETLPDPAKDDSILKLKDDAAFWSFVQSLPKS